MKNFLILISISLFLMGCEGMQGIQGPSGSAIILLPSHPTPPPVPTSIQAIVNSENSYRASLGEAPFTPGLSCTVQAIASGNYLSSSSPGYTAAEAIVTTGTSYAYLLSTGFDQPNSGPGPNSVINPEIQPLFEANDYKINCTGQLVVSEDGYYSFTMSSDDGSLLYIDGTLVIDNDGQHGITTMSGTKGLESAVTHTFQLEYAQSGGGEFALMLDMNGSLLPAANLYH
jgi:hypothetical protein